MQVVRKAMTFEEFMREPNSIIGDKGQAIGGDSMAGGGRPGGYTPQLSGTHGTHGEWDTLAVDYDTEAGPMDRDTMVNLVSRPWYFTGTTYLTALTGTFKVKAETYKLVVNQAVRYAEEGREQPILIVRDETNQYDPNAMPVYWFSGTKRSSLPRQGCRTKELPPAHDGIFLGFIPSAAGGYLNRELEGVFSAPNYSGMGVKVLGAIRKAPMATTNGSVRTAPNVVLSIRPQYTAITDPLAAVDIISAIGM